LYKKNAKTIDLVSTIPFLSISLVRGGEYNDWIIFVMDTLTHIVECVTILWNL